MICIWFARAAACARVHVTQKARRIAASTLNLGITISHRANNNRKAPIVLLPINFQINIGSY